MSGPFLTTGEVADLLRVSTRSVAELTRTARVPYRRLPGTRRCLFTPAELEAWLDGAELEVVDLGRGGRIVRPIVS